MDVVTGIDLYGFQATNIQHPNATTVTGDFPPFNAGDNPDSIPVNLTYPGGTVIAPEPLQYLPLGQSCP